MLRTAFILSALALSAAPAMADPESWVVECASSSPGPWDGSMICNEGKMLEVSAPNEGQKMLLHIGAPTTHCSEVSYVINRLPGGSDPIAIVERLKPGEDKIVELGDGWGTASRASGQDVDLATSVEHVTTQDLDRTTGVGREG